MPDDIENISFLLSLSALYQEQNHLRELLSKQDQLTEEVLAMQYLERELHAIVHPYRLYLKDDMEICVAPFIHRAVTDLPNISDELLREALSHPSSLKKLGKQIVSQNKSREGLHRPRHGARGK